MRPILMTAISTLSSIFPLVIATGAGAGSRQSLGTDVFGGMLVATFLSLFVVPILYIIIKQLTDRGDRYNKRIDTNGSASGAIHNDASVPVPAYPTTYAGPTVD